METLGEFLRLKRDEKGFSLRELAKRIACTAPFVSDIELGRRHPSGDVLSKLALALGVDEKELRERDQRAPIDDIKRVTKTDPTFALAFRTVIDKKIPAEDLLKWAQEQSNRKKRK
jgi:transcriptional regulator with XRE-family HTH domain